MKMKIEGGLGTVNLRYVYEDLDRHGNVRIYFKRSKGSKKIRLRCQPGSREFFEEYKTALAGEIPPQQSKTRPQSESKNSLHALCVAYFDSIEFKRLSPSTRKVRRRILENTCIEKIGDSLAGNLPHELMEPRHVRQLCDAKAEFPEAANGRLKALRQVFAWACEPTVGLAPNNPAMDIKYWRSASDGFHTWTIGELKAFESTFPLGTKARLAFDLLLYTGVRRSDVVRLGRQMEHAGFLRFTEVKGQSKSRKVREIPILRPLRASIDAFGAQHLTFITTEFGRPFTPNGFGNWFKKKCREACLPHCSAHGLRKAGATIAAENGATEHQLMAMYGWDSPKQAALYTRKADRKLMAAKSMHLILPDTGVDESSPLSSHRIDGGKQ